MTNAVVNQRTFWGSAGHDEGMNIGGVITAALGVGLFLIWYLFGANLPLIAGLPPVLTGLLIPLVFLLAGVMLAVVGLVLRSSSKR